MSDVQPCHDFTLTSAMLRTPLVNTPDSTRIATTQAIAGRTIAGASGLVAGCHGPRNRRVLRCRRNRCCRRTNASLQVQRIVLSQERHAPGTGGSIRSGRTGGNEHRSWNQLVLHLECQFLPDRHRGRSVPGVCGQLATANPRHGRPRSPAQLRRRACTHLGRRGHHPDLRLEYRRRQSDGHGTLARREAQGSARRSGREPRCEPTGRPIDQRVDVGIPERGAGRQTPGTARDRHER
jgi:hypothetical protein